MPLINEVKQVILDIMNDDNGWGELFQHHGWNFSSQDVSNMSEDLLKRALLDTVLTVDRSISDFEDFAVDGNRMISPGQPSRSLLYHALASCNVVERPDGTELNAFPSMKQMNHVENYVFGSRLPTLDQLAAKARNLLELTATSPLEMSIAVYATEYRPAPETSHRRHADLCLSRTGIARVGTIGPQYVGRERGFLVFAEGDGDHDIRVLPCRYSIFLAVKSRGREDRFGPVNSLSEENNDRALDFWTPIHKIFEGRECLAGIDLEVDLESHHFNQKIEKLVRRLRQKHLSNRTDRDLEQSPFRLQQDMANWADEDIYGPGVILPESHPLVEAAGLKGSPLTFTVPEMKENSLDFDQNFSPTLYLVGPGGRQRPWPEYAHIRQRMDVTPPEDINERPNVEAIATAGKYEALHYLDYSGDGWIRPLVQDRTINQPLSLQGVSFKQ